MRQCAPFSFLLLLCGYVYAAPPAVIPQPKSIACNGPDFVLGRQTRIILPARADGEVKLAAEALSRDLQQITGLKIPVQAGDTAKPKAGTIVLRQTPGDAGTGKEGYKLTGGKAVVIEAVAGRGLFYGVQTLRQLVKTGATPAIAGCEVDDSPTWQYRGVQLDPARNYMTLDFLKRQIDVISAYKLNYFHLHLTDTNAWRLEVKAYPMLASQQSYTQEQLRELVAYAKARFVTLVPEIEMPGHSAEFIRKMPALGHKGIMCTGNEETYSTLATIWKETAAIFDGPYLHLGGDETRDYLESPVCRSKWDQLRSGPNPPGSLVAYFLDRMNETVKKLGRQAVAWSVDKRHWSGKLPKDMVVMTWTSGAVDHAREGYTTINTYVKPLYFDHLHPLQAFLDWTPDDRVSEKLPNLIGAEGEAWHDPPVDHEQKVLENLGFYPRLLALAERVWGQPKPGSMQEFEQRLLEHKTKFFQGATFPYPPKVRDTSKPYPY